MIIFLLILIFITISHIDHNVAGTKHYLRNILEKLNK